MADETKRWPLVAQIDQRYETLTQDAILINGYCELDQLLKADAIEPSAVVYKRPGWKTYSNSSSSAGNACGVFNWQGDIYETINGTLYKNGISVGTGMDFSLPYTFTSCLGSTPKLVMHNTVQMWYYDSTDGLTQVTTFPANTVPGLAYLDGTIYVMDKTNHIYGSGINDPTSWISTNVLLAQIEPDSAVAVAKQLVYVMALKQRSIEFFYDAGNAAGSPLGPVQGAKISFGCGDAASIAQLEGDLFLVASNEEGGLSVWNISSLKPQPVSTPSVEKLLYANGVGGGKISAWAGRVAGHRYYGLTLFTLNIQIVFDLDSRLWYKWLNSTGTNWTVVDSCIGKTNNTLIQDKTGVVYELVENAFQDDTNNYTFQLVTPIFDMNTRMRKLLSRLLVVADQSSAGVLTIEFSDDDYQTWKTARTVDLSTALPMLTNCGTFQKRAIRLTMTSSTPLRLQALEYLADKGTL